MQEHNALDISDLPRVRHGERELGAVWTEVHRADAHAVLFELRDALLAVAVPNVDDTVAPASRKRVVPRALRAKAHGIVG